MNNQAGIDFTKLWSPLATIPKREKELRKGVSYSIPIGEIYFEMFVQTYFKLKKEKRKKKKSMSFFFFFFTENLDEDCLPK